MRELTRQFVPATDEVWRLQQGAQADARFFKSMADLGHYRGKGGTRQGVYVMSPGGVLLGSVNALNADQVAAMLRDALIAWNALPADKRRMPSDFDIAPSHRWEDSRPAGGLILQSTNRDFQEQPGEDLRRTPHWNRDHAWFTAREARGWIPPGAQVGNSVDVPQASRLRLACFHLLDNVRGQTLPFAPQEVSVSQLRSEVVGRVGQRVELRLIGRTEARTDGTWRFGEIHWKPSKPYPRSMRTRLRGRAVYDLAQGRFVEFLLIGVGRRSGYTANNARRHDPAPSLIGFAFELAPNTAGGGVAPTFIDVYNADWVRHP